MSTINITITALESDFLQFADELGYQAEVIKSPEELALLVEPISIQDRRKPNPQTKQQFLEEYLKGALVDELYRRKAGIIDAQVNATKEAEKASLKVGIASVVSVSSQI